MCDVITFHHHDHEVTFEAIVYPDCAEGDTKQKVISWLKDFLRKDNLTPGEGKVVITPLGEARYPEKTKRAVARIWVDEQRENDYRSVPLVLH